MSLNTELTERDLAPVNEMLEEYTVEEVLQWSFQVFEKPAILTSGQRAGSVLAKIVSGAGYKVDLLFSDTGVHFQETLETVEKISRHYDFPLKSCAPKLSMAEQNQQFGVLYLTHAGQEQCCHMRKVEPLLNLHEQYDALLGALRRNEGGRRSRTPIVSLDPTLKLVRINPMAKIDNERYEDLLKEPDTIVNPLHTQGYPTIGCNRCTTPVREDEHERAGRWRHLAGVEYCGINPTDFSRKTNSIELASTTVERLMASIH